MTEILHHKIQSKHLLNHPFYRAWSKGELTLEDLRFYAEQYFAHVRAFPTYLSEMHSRCENLEYRRWIAANLADEEATSPTHLDLWLDFAAGVGADADTVHQADIGPAMKKLTETYRSLAKSGTAAAAAALYCYENQIPDVAAAKIQGLQDNYAIRDASTLRYFTVHQAADVEHSAQWEQILRREQLDPARVAQIADQALGALWDALSEIHENRPAAQTIC